MPRPHISGINGGALDQIVEMRHDKLVFGHVKAGVLHVIVNHVVSFLRAAAHAAVCARRLFWRISIAS